MAERKAPRRTRERILSASLQLFNQYGTPSITTAHISDELNISPGNLYYHFRNKEEIVYQLYQQFDKKIEAALNFPEERTPHVEDLWLLLHLLFEIMWEYRFLYRDLDDLTERDKKLGAQFGRVIERGVRTVMEICRGMIAAGTMHANDREIEALANNITLVVTYWLSFQKLRRFNNKPESDLKRGAYQVMALVAPFLVGEARELLNKLSQDYL